ncbi:MAG: NADH-quinone oxidoreductase subunit C [Planctomycetota bacterium]
MGAETDSEISPIQHEEDSHGTGSSAVAALLAAIPAELRENILGEKTHHGQSALYVPRESAYPLLEHLRDAQGFQVLVDVTAVDFLNQDTPERFQVVYVLQRRALQTSARSPRGDYLRVNAWVPEEHPSIRSVFPLWRSAKWGERECHDMFGIVFEGNPDLRRLLMPEDYPGFPLLKDYPLKGRGERTQFPRVVPEGNEMKEKEVLPYPTSIGRGMHTPEYMKEIERDAKPKPRR